MLARAGAVGLVCLAVLVAPAAAKAPAAFLLVEPGSPVVGVRATIELHLTPAKTTSPVLVELVSPTGLRRLLALARVGPGHWRAAYRFLDDGSWKLSVAVGRLTAIDRVFVKQPPSALPPFALAPSSKPSAWGSGQGIGILIRLDRHRCRLLGTGPGSVRIVTRGRSASSPTTRDRTAARRFDLDPTPGDGASLTLKG